MLTTNRERAACNKVTALKRLLVFALAAVIVACDPGYSYAPQGWPKGQSNSFNHTEQNFRLSVHAINGLIGQKFITVEGQIQSLAQSSIVFEQPELVSNGVVYAGRYFGPDRPQNFAVNVGDDARLGLIFEFPKPLYEVLEERITFRVGYRVGKGDRQEFAVTLRRSSS